MLEEARARGDVGRSPSTQTTQPRIRAAQNNDERHVREMEQFFIRYKVVDRNEWRDFQRRYRAYRDRAMKAEEEVASLQRRLEEARRTQTQQRREMLQDAAAAARKAYATRATAKGTVYRLAPAARGSLARPPPENRFAGAEADETNRTKVPNNDTDNDDADKSRSHTTCEWQNEGGREEGASPTTPDYGGD